MHSTSYKVLFKWYKYKYKYYRTSRPHKFIQHYTHYFSNTAWNMKFQMKMQIHIKIWPPRVNFLISFIAFVSLWADSYPSFLSLVTHEQKTHQHTNLWWLTTRLERNSTFQPLPLWLNFLLLQACCLTPPAPHASCAWHICAKIDFFGPFGFTFSAPSQPLKG